MIRVTQEALTDLAVSAVVCAIRSDLAPVSTSGRELLAAAGPKVDERMQKTGTLPLGGAVITPAGELAADFLIHVVVMSTDEPQTDLTVQKALRNGLRRAADWSLESLAVPPLGIGVGLIEPEVSAHSLVAVLFEHLDEGEPPLDLTISVNSGYEVDLFQQIVEAASRTRRDRA